MHVLRSPRSVVLALLAALVSSGCISYRIDGLLARPELETYRRHTILGLSAEGEQILMAAYVRAFAGQEKTFIGGQEILGGPGQRVRLDENTRSRIAERFDVEAIVFARHEHRMERDRHVDTLSIRIVDAQTSEITGSVVVTARSYSEIDAGVLSEKAAQSLAAQFRRPAARSAAPDTAPARERSPRTDIRDTEY